jgi:hypothetical protein
MIFFVPTGNDLPGGTLCLQQYTPTCTLNATATSQVCGALAEDWNITSSDFVEYNDNVNATCDNLVIGQPVRVPSAPYAVRLTDQCLGSFSIVLRLDRWVLSRQPDPVLSAMNGYHLGSSGPFIHITLFRFQV